MNKLEQIKNKIHALVNSEHELEKDVRAFCADINNSLEDRWEVFRIADFGKVDSYIYNFNSQEVDDYFRASSYFDTPECYGRGAEIDLINFIDNLSYDVDEGDVENVSKLDVFNAMEQLMKDNIKGCKLDW